MFHQVEGLYVADSVSLADLKYDLLRFLSLFFEREMETLFRPSYFPFVEPGADVHIRWVPEGQEPRWLEILGCGVVHPKVLEAVGIDPERYTGYAFGMGVESRLAYCATAWTTCACSSTTICASSSNSADETTGTLAAAARAGQSARGRPALVLQRRPFALPRAIPLMKLPEHWLREWVNPPADAAALAQRLNLAGLECEVEPPPPLPVGVVVARIVSLEPHPQAERLRVCQVDAGGGSPLTIVCGAANARAGMLAPAARPGARLPDGKEIGKAELRGTWRSAGMLCSAAELGLAPGNSGQSEGLLELDPKATPGTPIEAYLRLDDRLFNLELTPNRGDCLSIAGLARELAALYGMQQTPPVMRPAVVCAVESLEALVEDAEACPRYLGRAITRLETKARTPDWMRERLRRCGIRSIHPMVDITNYVMLEPRPADARLRLRQAEGPHRGAPRARRREAGPAQRANR